MNHENGFRQRFDIHGGNFHDAGRISTKIKEILQELGIESSIVRRAAIAAYEAEMNVVMYADKASVTLDLTPPSIQLTFKDRGQGIRDIAMAMKEGFSTATDEMREMGFGAGMGLPNIKKNADNLTIFSVRGKGTTLVIIFNLNKKNV